MAQELLGDLLGASSPSRLLLHHLLNTETRDVHFSETFIENTNFYSIIDFVL